MADDAADEAVLLGQLAALRETRLDLERREHAVVKQLRTRRRPTSWTRIGAASGRSYEGARRRFIREEEQAAKEA